MLKSTGNITLPSAICTIDRKAVLKSDCYVYDTIQHYVRYILKISK